jgi:hypothetical protein
MRPEDAVNFCDRLQEMLDSGSEVVSITLHIAREPPSIWRWAFGPAGRERLCTGDGDNIALALHELYEDFCGGKRWCSRARARNTSAMASMCRSTAGASGFARCDAMAFIESGSNRGGRRVSRVRAAHDG